MDFEQDGKRGQLRFRDRQERPQPEHRISLTLAVTDPAALWVAAATALLRAPDMTMDDVVDVIGPREDPAITSCIAAIAKPIALAGCVLDDFWIDSLHGCPPRSDTVGPPRGGSVDSVLEYNVTAAELLPRRPSHKRRQTPHLALCMLPPLHRDAQGAPVAAKPE